MRLRILIQILLLCFTFACSAAAEIVRVATFNLRNYNSVDRRAHDTWHRNYPKPEVEKEALRTVLHSLNADIVAFQEIGPMPYLVELQRDLKQEGLDYPYHAHLQAQDAVRCLGVLSRVPIASISEHALLEYTHQGAPQSVRRGLLGVTFESAGEGWTLYVVHLKSRLSDDETDPDSRKQRMGEATAIRNQILREQADLGRYLIVGDFNDSPDSPALARFLKKGDTVIAHDLRPTDIRGAAWTYYHSRSDTWERIDYILASPVLVPAVKRKGIYEGPSAQAASDHRPLYIDLELEEVPAAD